MVCIDGVEPSSANPQPDAVQKPAIVELVDKDVMEEEKTTVEGSDPASESPTEGESQEAEDKFTTGSEVMDDILTHAQTRMLEAIDVLSRRVDILADAARKNSDQDVKVAGQVVMSPQIA